MDDDLAADAARFRWLLDNRVYEATEYGDLELRFLCCWEHYNDVRKAIDEAMRIKSHTP